VPEPGGIGVVIALVLAGSRRVASARRITYLRESNKVKCSLYLCATFIGLTTIAH